MKQKEFLQEMAKMLEQDEILGALQKLQSVSLGRITKLNLQSAEVRRQIGAVLDAGDPYLDSDRRHMRSQMLFIIEKFQQFERLLPLASRQYEKGDYEGARSILRAAIASDDSKIRLSAIESSRSRGHELIKSGAMLDAFDFFEVADPAHPLGDTETHEPFITFADEKWQRTLPDCEDGDQFVRQGMPKIFRIYESLNRPDRLYDLCGYTLKVRELTFVQQQLHPSADFPGKRGWSAHIIDAYHRALQLAVPIGDHFALKDDQIRDIGDTMLRHNQFQDARTAYSRIGDWERMEKLGVDLLKNTQFEDGIRSLRICTSQGATFSQETGVAIALALSHLLQTEPIEREGHGRHRTPISSRKRLEQAKEWYEALKKLHGFVRS